MTYLCKVKILIILLYFPMKKILLFIIASCVSAVLFAQTTVTYTFDDLAVGALNGQDEWVSVKHSAGGGINVVDYIGPNGWTAPDESLCVFFNNANTNYGEVATRKSTENFSFDFSQGGTFQIELDIHRNWWGVAFGVGYDADGNGSVLPPMNYETVYPNPALSSQDGGVYFISTGNDPRPEYTNGIVLPNNTLCADFDYDYADWTRWRIFLDLDANNGAGSVALFADYGITGEFEPIPEIQGVNVGLTPGSGDRFDPAMWDGVFFLSSSHGGFDNFTLTYTPSGLASQFIDFTEIPDKLISAEPFNVSATATSGLPVTFEVLEGPATIDGNTVTLTGEAGIVKIKASQSGNEQWQAAPSVNRSFEVVDPSEFQPTLVIRRPYNDTKVYMESLQPVMLLASVDIEHSDVILVESIEMTINGETLTCSDAGNNYYSTYWTPTNFGNHSVELNVSMSGDNAYSISSTFDVTDDIEDLTVISFNGDYHISPSNHSVTGEFVFPTFVGAFDAITASLDMVCASGGCDTYDRVCNIWVKNIHGDKVELIKYITAFGVHCSDATDVTDYASALQGLVELQFQVVTWNGGGYLPVLTFDFQKGTPEYKYSDIVEIWGGVYDFGDYANPQPLDPVEWIFNPFVEKSSLIMCTTGHNWSSNTSPNYSVNTGNAAEFYEATHHVNVNGETKFMQHLWQESGSCSPNPAGCQPQNGTWVYPRAGWCPGSIGMVWNWDLTEYIASGAIDLNYVFDPDYTDFCHPNYPDCVDGQNGCPNCAAPDNPILNLSGKIVTYSNSVNMFVGIDDDRHNTETSPFGINIFPNPSHGVFEINANAAETLYVTIINISTGQHITSFNWSGEEKTINLSNAAKGTYILKAQSRNGVEIKKIIIL